MSLLLGFLLCWLLTDKTMAISRTYLTNVQIVEPFVWCYADGDSILYAALVMMLMLSLQKSYSIHPEYLMWLPVIACFALAARFVRKHL